jgi:hypothetical protein
MEQELAVEASGSRRRKSGERVRVGLTTIETER